MSNIGLTITLIFIILISVIFSTFFSASLARLKGRSRAFGILGFLFNILGLIIVCFLPSKRKDMDNTNPIAYFTSRIPNLSKKTIYISLSLVIAIVLTVIAYDNIPDMLENRKYSKQITEANKSKYEQASEIKGTISKIFVGTESSFVITENGDAYCFGKQHSPQVENANTGTIYQNTKKVLSTDKTCYILTNDGKFYSIEEQAKTDTNESEPSEDLIPEYKLISENVKDFSVSEQTVGFITKDNSLYMYGNNSYGQLGTANKESKPTPIRVLTNANSVSCEATYTVVLKENGEVVAFGSNIYGQFGKEGTYFSSPTTIATNIKQIATGDDFIMLLAPNGELQACGNNDCGQLGNTTNENFTKFTVILSDVKKIGAAKKSAFALKNSNELYAWGQNTVGQLGINNNQNTSTPTLSSQNTTDFQTSGLHTVIIKENKVEATGYGNYGQVGYHKTSNTFSSLVTIKQ